MEEVDVAIDFEFVEEGDNVFVDVKERDVGLETDMIGVVVLDRGAGEVVEVDDKIGVDDGIEPLGELLKIVVGLLGMVGLPCGRVKSVVVIVRFIVEELL